MRETQTALAKRLGVHRNVLRGWLKGTGIHETNRIQVEELLRQAEAQKRQSARSPQDLIARIVAGLQFLEADELEQVHNYVCAAATANLRIEYEDRDVDLDVVQRPVGGGRFTGPEAEAEQPTSGRFR